MARMHWKLATLPLFRLHSIEIPCYLQMHQCRQHWEGEYSNEIYLHLHLHIHIHIDRHLLQTCIHMQCRHCPDQCKHGMWEKKAELMGAFKSYQGGRSNSVHDSVRCNILTSTFRYTVSSSCFLVSGILWVWARFTSYLAFIVLVSSIWT